MLNDFVIASRRSCDVCDVVVLGAPLLSSTYVSLCVSRLASSCPTHTILGTQPRFTLVVKQMRRITFTDLKSSFSLLQYLLSGAGQFPVTVAHLGCG